MNVNLKEADLEGANLTNATLIDVNLQETNLKKANLKNAKFGRPNFIGAMLMETDLQETIFYHEKALLLSGQHPTPQQIIKAKNWEKAIYRPDFFTDVEKFLIEKIESIIIETCFKSRYNRLFIFTQLNIIVDFYSVLQQR